MNPPDKRFFRLCIPAAAAAAIGLGTLMTGGGILVRLDPTRGVISDAVTPAES